MAGASVKGRASNALPPLVIRYMRRMKRQRVYTYEVRWQAGGRRTSTPSGNPAVLRLVVAGAQVVPVERPLDPAKADDRALFYVTPLARGWLRGERLEVLVDGRKVQETPLPSRVVSQRTTWVLLALTFLVPWLGCTYIKGPPEAGYLPGTQLERFLDRQLKPAVDFAKEKDVDVADTVQTANENVKEGLNRLHELSWEMPLVLYIAGGFLVLTLLSCWVHRDKRKKRVSKPIPLPETEELAPPLATRRAAVEPVR